jgi:hypothetical protein
LIAYASTQSWSCLRDSQRAQTLVDDPPHLFGVGVVLSLLLAGREGLFDPAEPLVQMRERVLIGIGVGLLLLELVAERFCGRATGVRVLAGQQCVSVFDLLAQLRVLLLAPGVLGLKMLVAVLPVDLLLRGLLLGRAGCPFGSGNSRRCGPAFGGSGLLTHGECSFVSSRVLIARIRRFGGVPGGVSRTI